MAGCPVIPVSRETVENQLENAPMTIGDGIKGPPALDASSDIVQFRFLLRQDVLGERINFRSGFQGRMPIQVREYHKGRPKRVGILESSSFNVLI